MSLRPHFFFMAFLACASAVHAIRPAATPSPKTDSPAKAEAPKPTEPLPPYELKNRSSFTLATDSMRAPFWPIGWVKRDKSMVANAPVQDLAPKVSLDAKSFRVTSILLGSGATASLAVINGRAYSEGEFLRFPRAAGTTPPRVRVQRITDGNVTLLYADQTLVAPLARPELSSPKPEQLLDEKDR